jgi:hypothetical protein
MDKHIRAVSSVQSVPSLYNEGLRVKLGKNIRGLNLAEVMCMTVQATRLSL